MEQIITTIRKMKIAREKMYDAMEEWHITAKPLLSNIGVIPKIYDIFKSVLGEKAQSTNGKKEFTFIIVFLYSPQRFFGGKMSDGLRKEIGRTLHLNSPNYISLIFPDLMLSYTTYKDFKSDVDKVISVIGDKLIR